MRVTGLLLALLAGCATAGHSDTSHDAPATGGGSDASSSQLDAPVVMPDANTCATQPCDILTQCGCGTGMACDVNAMTLMGTACRSVTMMGHETSTCSSIADCDRGYVCLGPSGGAACKKYCSSNADCGSPRGQCVIDVSNGTSAIPGIPSVCSSNCDPINTAAGGCPTGFKCSIFTATHQGIDYNIADCSKAGTGVQGTNCKPGAQPDDTLCGPNFLCTTTDNTAFACRKICNKTSPGTTCGQLTCIGFNPALTIAGVEYGVCN